MSKKKKDLKLIEKIKNLKPAFKTYIVITSIITLLLPLVLDFVMPKEEYNSSVVSPQDLIVIDDAADLLTYEQEQEVYKHMLPITEYSCVAFYTTDSNYSSTVSYAHNHYNADFGWKSGTVLLIDMSNREIYICSAGGNKEIVTNGKAETITDNVYRYASSGDYDLCATNAFDQVYAILKGNHIPEPMKHIGNSLLAFAISLVIVFIIANAKTRIAKTTEADVIKQMSRTSFYLLAPKNLSIIKERKTRHYEGSDSGGYSGGGGGSSGGGGGGGGGGFSGGGHGF